MERNSILITGLLMTLFSAPAFGQEFRALISGTVVDPSGAAVPAAAVSATNLSTNLHSTTNSGIDGNFVLAQLPPGPYELTVEARGFRVHRRSGIALSVGDKAVLRITLEVGATNESVTVNAELTGIEQNQSILGQVMDNKKVSELPLNGRQVYQLLQLSAGVLFTITSPTGLRGWDAGGPFVIQGSFQSTNAFLLDGAPNGVRGQWDYAPLVDAVDEFKLTTPVNDASQGLTGGGVINMTMKSGTNQLHGLLSEFFRNNIFDANRTQANAAAAQSPWLKQQQHQFNSFAGMLSGPIIRNKFFYSGNYEGFRERVPSPLTQTVPTIEQRGGDFSRTFNAANQLIVIYDPQSTQQSGSSFVRDAFPGNKIPAARTVPVARNVLTFVPLPNAVTSPVTNFNNFVASPNIFKYRYDSFFVKFDYVWNERHHTFASTTQWHGEEFNNQNGLPYGNPARQGPDPNNRASYGATLDHVWNVRPSTVVDARISWERYTGKRALTTNDSFDGSALGFTGVSGSTPTPHFPNLTFTNYLNLGSGVSEFFTPTAVYSAVVDVSKAAGRHFVKFGMRTFQDRFSLSDSGQFHGLFGFTPAWTQRNPQSADATSGNAMASFLLGFPASGSADVTPSTTQLNTTVGFYVQDDFKVSSRLMLNLGLRWDIQTPTRERFNQANLAFDPSVTYQLGASKASGGITFADSNHRESWSTNYRDFQPRLGLAYRALGKLVLRAGYGLTFLGENSNNNGYALDLNYQNGFARTTPFVATTGGGLNSFIPGLPGTGTLQNPFPQGILQPFGSALGPKTGVGQAMNSWNPDYVIPRVHQFNAGFDYELPGKITTEVSYVGTRTRDYGASKQLNAIALSERLKGFADPNYLNAAVPNPFAGAADLVGTSLAAATITRSQSLLPFPQFTGVTVGGLPQGGASYNALEMRVNKRLSRGLTVVGAFTWSKTLWWTGYREPQYTELERTFANFARPLHLTVNALWNLPLGKGQPIGRNWGRLLNGVLGNWQYNLIVEAASGTATAMPDATPIRSPKLPAGQQSYDHWFNTCTLLTNGQRSHCASADEPITWVQLKPNELRTYNSKFPNISDPWATRIDTSVFKLFPIREKVRLEFRAEAFNAFNTPIYSGPDTGVTSPTFGVVTRSQQNFPRNMQFALRLLF